MWSQWERIHLNPQRLDMLGWGDPHSLTGQVERVGGRIVGGSDQESDSEQEVK